MKSILLLLVAALSLTACEQSEDSGYSYDFPVYDPKTDPAINDYLRKNTPLLTIPEEIKNADLTHQFYSCPDISGSYEYRAEDGTMSILSFKKDDSGSLNYADGLGEFTAVDGKTERDGQIASCNGGNIMVKVEDKVLADVYIKMKPSADGRELALTDRFSLTPARTYIKNHDLEDAVENHSSLECPDFRGQYTAQQADGSNLTYIFNQSAFGALSMNIPSISEYTALANGQTFGERTQGVLACRDNKLLWVIRDEKRTIRMEFTAAGDDISLLEKPSGETSILKASPSI